MAYTPPTIDDFFGRYPEFEDIDEDRAQIVLDWAISQVGPTWIEKDRTPAILALTAATLDDEGALTATSIIEGVSASGPVTSATVGPLSVKYQTGAQSEGGSSGATGAVQETAYRTLLNMLRRRSFPPVGII